MEPTHFETLYPADTRFEEIEKLLSFVKGGNSCQVVGIPGVGRSLIFRLLTYNHTVREKHLGENQKWFHFVLVNFSEVRNRPLLDVTKFLFLSLITSLRERRMTELYEKVNDIFKEHLALQDELVLFQGLKYAIDLLAIEKELTIVFLFDRFEEYIPSVTSDFFANLRVLRDRAKYRFSAVFSLNRRLEEIVDPLILTDFDEFVVGNRIYVCLYDKPSIDFRLSYIEHVTGKTIEKDIKEQIISLTGGHSRLVKQCTEAVLAGTAQSHDLEAFFLKQVPILKALAVIWQSFSPAEQQCLLKLTGEHDEDVAIFLTKMGVIHDKTITIPLLGSFITNEEAHVDTTHEKIVFEANTNSIMKGDSILSDRLTSSEYKLLSFFLENEGRVIDRDEIISSVWKDAKSTAGVTDQALDQLISRLRKKIEDNPNIPTHLLTVKGRGFSFTS